MCIPAQEGDDGVGSLPTVDCLINEVDSHLGKSLRHHPKHRTLLGGLKVDGSRLLGAGGVVDLLGEVEAVRCVHVREVSVRAGGGRGSGPAGRS